MRVKYAVDLTTQVTPVVISPMVDMNMKLEPIDSMDYGKNGNDGNIEINDIINNDDDANNTNYGTSKNESVNSSQSTSYMNSIVKFQ